MGLVATDTGGGDFSPAPAGNHVAVCVKVVDLGTQETTYMGTRKSTRQVLLTWELSNELKVFKEENGPEPFLLSKRYTLSLGQKANLRKDLESWRGRPFSADELKGFDLSNVLGKPCLLNVIHTEKGDRTYANIASVSPIPKGMEKPRQINDSVNYVIQEHNPSVFAGLSEYLQTKIKLSPEYRGFVEGHSEAHESNGEGDGGEDGDIPF